MFAKMKSILELCKLKPPEIAVWLETIYIL